MSHARIEVLVPGLQTTVQDLGRWGYQALGVPVAGPMDPFSHRLANALVGNPKGAATLEVTLVGPELRFSDQRTVAVAGAEFAVTLDGVPLPHETAARTRPGSVLRFGGRLNGARAYIAVEGGVDAPPVLGSRATHIPSGMGGWKGRALIKGDVLPLGEPGVDIPVQRGRLSRVVPGTDAEPPAPVAHARVVRVLPGPDVSPAGDGALRQLTSGTYRVAPDSNRMGYRLEGPAIDDHPAPDIVSDATPLGTVQVPGSGQPVLLMADRQTTGGYARLATVISADIPIVAQAAPGDTLVFDVVARAEAVAALIARERPLLAIEPQEP